MKKAKHTRTIKRTPAEILDLGLRATEAAKMAPLSTRGLLLGIAVTIRWLVLEAQIDPVDQVAAKLEEDRRDKTN